MPVNTVVHVNYFSVMYCILDEDYFNYLDGCDINYSAVYCPGACSLYVTITCLTQAGYYQLD